MWSELILIIVLILKYKLVIAIPYLVFWILIYIKRKYKNKKDKKKYENDFDSMRTDINNCYKISERLIILIDLAFFGYMFLSIVI